MSICCVCVCVKVSGRILILLRSYARQLAIIWSNPRIGYDRHTRAIKIATMEVLCTHTKYQKQLRNVVIVEKFAQFTAFIVVRAYFLLLWRIKSVYIFQLQWQLRHYIQHLNAVRHNCCNFFGFALLNRQKARNCFIRFLLYEVVDRWSVLGSRFGVLAVRGCNFNFIFHYFRPISPSFRRIFRSFQLTLHSFHSIFHSFSHFPLIPFCCPNILFHLPTNMKLFHVIGKRVPKILIQAHFPGIQVHFPLNPAHFIPLSTRSILFSLHFVSVFTHLSFFHSSHSISHSFRPIFHLFVLKKWNTPIYRVVFHFPQGPSFSF